MEMVRNYKELVVWQRAMELVTEVYRATATFPEHEKFGLVSQLRRAAVSVPSNIAEGQGRYTVGEFRQFLAHARGSLFEVETQTLIAKNLALLGAADTTRFSERIEQVGRLLNGLLRSLNRKD
jgi:four helix bundle protein